MISDAHGQQARSTGLTPPSAQTAMTGVTGVSADTPKVNDYSSFAEAYSAENETNLINAHYERPAMLALAGDVAGRRILDAGCGCGPLCAALRDRGALVSGFDARPRLAPVPPMESVASRPVSQSPAVVCRSSVAAGCDDPGT
ncbi:SAM-dependent methyltransferase [Streptomyces sp. 3330]|nr:SAM-dependent methyltransferase [Streptomyces sp. 3330]